MFDPTLMGVFNIKPTADKPWLWRAVYIRRRSGRGDTDRDVYNQPFRVLK